MRATTWPKVSIVAFTFNDREGIKKALDSVKRQSYPKEKIEIVVIDNGSVDDSRDVAREYTNKIYIYLKNVYENRADGMRKATGEFIYMVLEDDMELRGKHFFQKLLKPMLEDDRIVASFTREYPKKSQGWVTRFISYHPIQCDPLFEFLTPSIDETIIKKNVGYSLCKYVLGKVPPTTHMLFRKSFLQKTPVWKQEKDFDHDTIISLVSFGYNFFAYVPSAGDYHHHAKNLKELIGKRVRNLNLHYFPYQESIGFKWLDVNDKFGVAKMIFWVIYANLFIPELIRGFARFLKHRDWVLLMEPVVAIAATDAILFQFIKNRAGRKIRDSRFSRE